MAASGSEESIFSSGGIWFSINFLMGPTGDMDMPKKIRVGNRITIYPRGKKRIYNAEFWHNGQHCRRSLKTPNLKVARERAVKLENELLVGELQPAMPTVSIEKSAARYIEFCKTENLRPRTVKKYQTLLQGFATFSADRGVQLLGKVTPNLIDEFRSVRSLTLKPKSMKNEGVTLKGFLRWCQSRGLISANPMIAMTFRRIPSPPRGGPSPDQVSLLLTRSKPSRVAQFALLAYTGCRSGELQRLRTEDVDLAGGWIHIVSREGAETKTGGSRKVPIHPALRDLLAKTPRSPGPWFFTAPPSKKYPDGGHWISTKHLNEDFLELLQAVGIPAGREGGFTIHSLRHSFETVCVNANIPQRAIDTWLGHNSDQSMASVYYRLTDEESQRFMSQVPFGLGPAVMAGN